jgi:hypothetical protein
MAVSIIRRGSSGKRGDGVKRYKFQARVVMGGDGDGDPHVMPGSVPYCMVLRGRNGNTGHSQFFSALFSWADEVPFRPHEAR